MKNIVFFTIFIINISVVQAETRYSQNAWGDTVRTDPYGNRTTYNHDAWGDTRGSDGTRISQNAWGDTVITDRNGNSRTCSKDAWGDTICK